MSMHDKEILLTGFSHGAGCGCKIAPQVLREILGGHTAGATDRRLLTGNEGNEDAAAYDLGNGMALLSTTDFFMPIVDDAFDFGRVAAANAISDVYAMGGKPILALAILGWPLEKLPASLAARVTDGARSICSDAGIVLAGGHTIDNKEPLFGLCVNGLVEVKNLKKNSTAKNGDLLFLTKPVGTGILSTARKKNLLTAGDYSALVDQLVTLNKTGEVLGELPEVHAMTDVTGFGLLGHTLEMAEASGLSAELWYGKIPKMRNAAEYVAKGAVPDATYRNWNAFQSKVSFEEGVNVAEAFTVLPDPQTNGGLLIAVDRAAEQKVRSVLSSNGLGDYCEPVGEFRAAADKPLVVKK